VAPALLPEATPRLESIAVDARVLAFAALVSLLTSLLFGLLPAWRSSRVDPAAALGDASRGSTGRSGLRLRRGLTAAQCALASLLLVSAGLLGRSLYGLLNTPTGMRADEALTISTYLPTGGYADGRRVAAFYREAVERVAALPGVLRAGASMDRPLAPLERRAFVIEGRDPSTQATAPVVFHTWITPGYLEALGVPLLAGRALQADDDERTDPVILISESAAQLYWPGENPIGRRLMSGGGQRWLTVVGIVGDLREAGLDQQPHPHTYTPIAQVPEASLGENVIGLFRSPSVVVSVAGSPRPLAGLMRRSLEAMDPRLALQPALLVRESVERTLDTRRFATVIVGAFAAAALLIAAVGLHGVLAFGVAQRSREIGIRVALGATRARIIRQVAGDGARLAAFGVGAGLLMALGVTGLMQGVLVGVSPSDPATFFAVAVVVAMVGAVALWLPARTAARISPAATVRES
jgi:predicted permease